jgi:hypothetical protein
MGRIESEGGTIMADYLTTCLSTEEASVKEILTKAPFNHQYVRTLRDFVNGDLHLNTYAPGGAPARSLP